MFPYCHCNCPNGLSICGHLVALMLLIHLISYLLVDKSFEDMLCCFPEPLNRILQVPLLVQSIWPPHSSTEPVKKKAYIYREGKKKAAAAIMTNHRFEDDDISDGQTVDKLEEIQTEHTTIAVPRIPDAGTSHLDRH